jgi:hypothetical protein
MEFKKLIKISLLCSEPKIFLKAISVLGLINIMDLPPALCYNLIPGYGKTRTSVPCSNYIQKITNCRGDSRIARAYIQAILESPLQGIVEGM